MVAFMSDVTRILSAIEAGDPQAAEQLLPLVYDELRKLAAQKLAQEKPGQTLDATALVHEAYLRLVGRPRCSPIADDDAIPPASVAPAYSSSRHFFLAAAEAMRRILIDNARRKQSLKRGGGRRVEVLDEQLIAAAPDEQLVALDDALTGLGEEQPRMADLVKLHFFVGLTLEQSAEALGVSLRTAKRDWTFARAWLRRAMDRQE
jgi:RNA polymerase sigma factor (sigma-70 family)